MTGPIRIGGMTLDERIARDGERWRYIFYLERELESRKTRQWVLRGSLFLNGFLITTLISWWAA